MECLTGFLETVTSKLVAHVGYHPATAQENVKSPDFLKVSVQVYCTEPPVIE